MKLYETLNAKNWRKGPSTSHGRGCLVKHMIALHPNDARTYLALDEACLALFPDRCPNEAGNVSAFNDHPDTTLDDVIRVCKFADV